MLYYKPIPFLFLFWSLSFYVGAQPELRKIKTEIFKRKKITYVTVDRLGNFFIVFNNGHLKKYNAQGQIITTIKKINCTSIEAWQYPTVFIYNRSTQTYTTFNHSFDTKITQPIESSWAIEPWLVCPSGNHLLWLYDKADASIKKINQKTSEVITEVSIDTSSFTQSSSFTYLREYQDLLFLLNPTSGIMIFNHIGKSIHKIETKGINFFSFFGEELYYSINSTIYFYNLYSGKTRELPLLTPSLFSIVTDEYILAIESNTTFSLFEYHPD